MSLIHVRRAACGVALLLLAVPAAGAQAPAGDPTARLHALFTEEWERRLRENPTFASALGDRRYNTMWPDLSLEAIERSHTADREVLRRLVAIDRGALPPAEQLNYDLFHRQYEESVAAHRFREFLIPLNQRGGIQTADNLAESLRFQTVRDHEDWIARLRGLGTQVDANIALMRRGIAERRVHPRVIMERIPEQVAAQLVDDPARSPFYKPFAELPDSFPAATRQRLQREAQAAIREVVVPAYRRFDRFFRNDYLAATRASIGAWDLPDGAELYAFRARAFTTTDLTPDSIFAIGMTEVARIRSQMEAIIRDVGFEGTFAQFLAHLRTDPRFYHETPEALFEAYLAASKRVDPELVRLFGTLPRMPYGVRPIPDAVAPHTTTAYYSRPAADGSRAGYYYVNLYRPETRPIYEIEALTLHEAVPGHHLQIALSMELGELPEFRRFGGFTAFTEGWGLYAESLGEEMGFYRDPYSKFGQLTYEMWRAVRLVVDAGMHHKRWTREQAIEFFASNAAKSEHDIVNEIDRYIAWPGQALAYKIGELKIKELRALATERLGPRFDLRAFHDVVLGSGAVPLDVLERNVEAWIAGRIARAGPAR
ncbi:MAG TPA: DUF885 domain-containing protein [Gemmatimonadaceae bacterium]|nr:DUF885 domain-containing protein [Gemmatimonadaceae bacterium]